jgi:hypothetical protein
LALFDFNLLTGMIRGDQHKAPLGNFMNSLCDANMAL